MPVTDDRSAARRTLARGRLARGAVAGLAAWLGGYLVAYVWKAGEVAEALDGIGVVSRLLGGEAVSVWKGVSWLFLNAHFVDTRVPTVAGGTRTVNFVTGEGGPAAAVAVPALALVAAGLVAAVGARGDALDRGKAGAAVAAGYLPLSAGAAFLTTHAIGATDAAVAPDPVTAVLLAGLAYPLALGALGGVLAGALD